MIMMLPFVLGMVAVWLGLRGKRTACCAMWILTLIVFGAWANFHMTDPLRLAL
jgi:lipoprotein signal peptidase